MLRTQGSGTRHHRRRLSDSALDELVTRPPRAALAMVKSNGRRKPATRRAQPFDPFRAHQGYIRDAINGDAPPRPSTFEAVTPPPRVCTSHERAATVPSFSFVPSPFNLRNPHDSRRGEAGASGSASAGEWDGGMANHELATVGDKAKSIRGITAPSLDEESTSEDRVSTNNPTPNDTTSENANELAGCCVCTGGSSSACGGANVSDTKADSEKPDKTQTLIKQSARQLSNSLLYPGNPVERAERCNHGPVYKVRRRYVQLHDGRWRSQTRVEPIDDNAQQVRAMYEALRSPTGNAPAPDIDSLLKTLNLMDAVDAQLDELNNVVNGMIAGLAKRGGRGGAN